MKVYIRKIESRWVLTFETESEVSSAFQFTKLIDALDAACLLKVHVANADELPLNQYYRAAA